MPITNDDGNEAVNEFGGKCPSTTAAASATVDTLRWLLKDRTDNLNSIYYFHGRTAVVLLFKKSTIVGTSSSSWSLVFSAIIFHNYIYKTSAFSWEMKWKNFFDCKIVKENFLSNTTYRQFGNSSLSWNLWCQTYNHYLNCGSSQLSPRLQSFSVCHPFLYKFTKEKQTAWI